MRRASGRTSGNGSERHRTGCAKRNSSAARASSPSEHVSIVERPSPIRQRMPPMSKPASPASTLLSEARAKPRNYFRTVARLMQQAACAREHAHAMGVVHRDIKPGNLLLDKRGNLWVTDFGLAQFHTDAELTRTGDLLGTLRYMSPEQATGGRVLLDHRTDIYSLGRDDVRSRSRSSRSSRGAIGTFCCAASSKTIRGRRERSNRTFRWNWKRSFSRRRPKAPADRYATAQQFADDLQRWLDDKPILARRPALAERVRRWGRRHGRSCERR